MTYDVIVIGSGLSGLSAGVELIKKGKRILILEALGFLGGRTSSWVQDGMQVESGLHRYLGFYKHFPQLISKAELNLNEIIIWEDEVEVKLANIQQSTVLGASPVYKPWKTIWSIIGQYNFLSLKDKLSLIPFVSKGLWYYYKKPNKLDKISIYDFAKETNVTDIAIQKIVTPLSTGIFFLNPKNYSAYNFFGLIAIPIPLDLHRIRVGAFRGGMTDVLANPLAKFITDRKGEVKTKAKVSKIVTLKERVVGVEVNGELINTNNVILATSLKPAQEILKNSDINQTQFTDFYKLNSIPVVTIQAELKNPSMEVDHTTFAPDTNIGCFAEQSRTTFKNTQGRISAIFSEPEKKINLTKEELFEIFYQDAKRLKLNIQNNVIRYSVTKFHDDFYSLEPGYQDFRPTTSTLTKGLYIAGDYTKQKYLGTMEGAVYSGKMAASKIT